MTRHINKAGLDLIKEFETFFSEPYRCPAKVLTIGYGHTRTAKPGMCVTKAQAEALLKDDVALAEREVNRLINVPLNDNQFAALVSLVFNVGSSPLLKTLGKKLNAGDYQGAADEILRWDKATVDGKLTVLPGLSRRRKAERALFLS